MKKRQKKEEEYDPNYDNPETKAAIKYMGNLLREWIDNEIIESIIREANKNEQKHSEK